MTPRAACLGAPVTDAAGKVAVSRSPSVQFGASVALTRLTKCQTPQCSSTARSEGTRTVPVAATRPRSLRTRSTIMTFSARSFADRSSSVAAGSRSRPAVDLGRVPLIGAEVTVSPSRRRNSSGETLTMACERVQIRAP